MIRNSSDLDRWIDETFAVQGQGVLVYARATLGRDVVHLDRDQVEYLASRLLIMARGLTPARETTVL